MLPDFPIQKKHISEFMQRMITMKIRQDPLLSMIHVHQVNEGDSTEIDSPGGFRDTIK